MTKLKKRGPQRKDCLTKNDWLHAMQIHRLCRLVLDYGGDAKALSEFLEVNHGGFGSWAFLFEEDDGCAS